METMASCKVELLQSLRVVQLEPRARDWNAPVPLTRRKLESGEHLRPHLIRNGLSLVFLSAVLELKACLQQPRPDQTLNLFATRLGEPVGAPLARYQTGLLCFDDPPGGSSKSCIDDGMPRAEDIERSLHRRRRHSRQPALIALVFSSQCLDFGPGTQGTVSGQI
ncbi:uncharacterized protein MYCFIDRAFT_176722 [Pseudocercospora fijiensis CIRAD86]|uniref:Uncharacterized protein n=1 Tax=Pseudocercospora fijiensis (strain CIRAD86) TaxID=383855 RepID=M2YUM8_PSEFD|nr:uncharacterized protein MYCFIDRAFT_176722 [Pseudocercospora fijiensis CIRAD86]EME81445.1 hypothetical protein MYCFIDRAFT_176722 [Pseudocercospora fijiensis CIRAD86]